MLGIAQSERFLKPWAKAGTLPIGISVLKGICSKICRQATLSGEHLRRQGFERDIVRDDMSVADFATENPHGTYILALSGHVVCVQNSIIYDTWDSGNEIVLYYWQKG